jgi:hypothetical protein
MFEARIYVRGKIEFLQVFYVINLISRCGILIYFNS